MNREHPETGELQDAQARRETEERELARDAAVPEETAQHKRRAEKAQYLREKLGERAESEREAPGTEGSPPEQAPGREGGSPG